MICAAWQKLLKIEAGARASVIRIPLSDYRAVLTELKVADPDCRLMLLTAAVEADQVGLRLIVRDHEGKPLALAVPIAPESELDQIVLPTISDLFAGAVWHEREAWDMWGLRFEGHPDLRRILLPEEWQGFPLRKSYALNTPCPPYRVAPLAADGGQATAVGEEPK